METYLTTFLLKEPKMRRTKFLSILFITILCQALLASASLAHHSGDHSVVLHTNSSWDECAIVLDPSLTQGDFSAFIGEVSELVYFRPIAGAKPLGRFKFELAIDARGARIEDWKPKWNNTFSHPHPDHWLVGDDHILAIPGVRGKMGITDRTDLELYFTTSPGSNYGFAGAAVKYAVVNSPGSKWGAAVRWSYLTLLGVDDMNLDQVSADFIVSRDIWLFRPYAGGALAVSYGVETTDKLNLAKETALSPMGLVGTEFVWRFLSIGIEQGFGKLFTTSLKAGVRF